MGLPRLVVVLCARSDLGSPSLDATSVPDVPRYLLPLGPSAQRPSGGLCWTLQLPWMALKVEMDPSVQPYLPRVSLCVP